jgi:hypothetical protein
MSGGLEVEGELADDSRYYMRTIAANLIGASDAPHVCLVTTACVMPGSNCVDAELRSSEARHD